MHDRADHDPTPEAPGRSSADRADVERRQAALDRLVHLGGERLASDLAAIFLEDAPLRLAAARAALRSGDGPAVARAAHGLKSSSAQLGAEALAEACEAMEAAAERGELVRAGGCLAVVETRYAAFSAWLAATVRPAPSADVATAGVAGPVIAVVEDNADNRLLVDALIGDRFVLHEYVNGGDALAGMRGRRPDLVLLDVSLPGMDGLEVLSRMRADPRLRDVPVVALTAHAMAGDRERYLAAGFDDYVAKPIVEEHALVRPIERLLARSGPRLQGGSTRTGQ